MALQGARHLLADDEGLRTQIIASTQQAVTALLSSSASLRGLRRARRSR